MMFQLLLSVIVAVLVLPANEASSGRPTFNKQFSRGIYGIMGGTPVSTEHKYPMLVSIRINNIFSNAGTLLKGKNGCYYVLTSAHCVFGKAPATITVDLGSHDISIFPLPACEQECKVSQVKTHPKYNATTRCFDAALLKLTCTPKITSHCIALGKLPSCSPEAMACTPAVIVGWGSKVQCQNQQMTPQDADIVILPDLACSGVPNYDSSKMICAGSLTGGVGPGKGDDGGPLLIKVNGMYETHGIVSLDKDCTKITKPGFYTKVCGKVKEWICKCIGC